MGDDHLSSEEIIKKLEDPDIGVPVKATKSFPDDLMKHALWLTHPRNYEKTLRQFKYCPLCGKKIGA